MKRVELVGIERFENVILQHDEEFEAQFVEPPGEIGRDEDAKSAGINLRWNVNFSGLFSLTYVGDIEPILVDELFGGRVEIDRLRNAIRARRIDATKYVDYLRYELERFVVVEVGVPVAPRLQIAVVGVEYGLALVRVEFGFSVARVDRKRAHAKFGQKGRSSAKCHHV